MPDMEVAEQAENAGLQAALFNQIEQIRAASAAQAAAAEQRMQNMQQEFARLMAQQVQNPPPQRGIGEGDNVHTYYQNRSAIRAPAIQRNDFEIKAQLINLVERHVFHGLASENPMDHIESFEEVCETTKANGVPSDYIKCKLFKHSLADKALRWLKSLPPHSLNGWDEARAAFLDNFYTKTKTAQLRARITNFSQKSGESFAEAWDRFKEYRRECPHHGFNDDQILRTFYDGLSWDYRTNLNSASNGNFMTQSIEGAYKLIDNMAQSSSDQSPEYDRSRKICSVETPSAAEIAELTAAKLRDFIQGNQQGINMIGDVSDAICYSEDAGLAPEDNQEVNYVNGQPYGQNRGFNNNYRNHPNLSYRSTNVANPQDQVYPPKAAAPVQKPFVNPSGNAPPAQGYTGYNAGYQKQYGQGSGSGYQGQNQFQPRQQAPPPPAPNPNEKLEAMMQMMLANQQKTSTDITSINGRLDAVTTHLKMLDTQVAQNAEAIKRQQGTFPAKGEQNPRKECHAVSVMEDESPVNSTLLNDHVPKHFKDSISPKQLLGFQKMVRRIPHALSFEQALEYRPLLSHFRDCRESIEEIEVLFLEARHTPPLRKLKKTAVKERVVSAVAGSDFSAEKPTGRSPLGPVDPVPPRDQSLVSGKWTGRSPLGPVDPMLRQNESLGSGMWTGRARSGPVDPVDSQPIRACIPNVPCPVCPRESQECNVVLAIKEDYFAEFEEIFEPAEPVSINTEECNAVEQNMTVPKLGDPGRFELSVQIDSTVFPRSLCDSGSGVNIMPYSVAHRLGFKDFSLSKFSLKFADQFVKRPIGILEDVQLLIGDVFVPADFVVVDMAEEPGDPLILGRPFLCTAGAKIDLKNGRIDLQLGDTEMQFEMDKLLQKHLTDNPPDPP